MIDILNLVIHGELKAPLPLLFVSPILASSEQKLALVSLPRIFFETTQSLVLDLFTDRPTSNLPRFEDNWATVRCTAPTFRLLLQHQEHEH